MEMSSYDIIQVWNRLQVRGNYLDEMVVPKKNRDKVVRDVREAVIKCVPLL